MDAIDLEILREMFPDGVFRIGGADPRISAIQIARTLGVSHTTVSSRIGRWTRSGAFWGMVALPNPSLLGRRLVGQFLESQSPDAGSRTWDALLESPEVVLAWERWAGCVWAVYLSANPAATERAQAARFSRIQGVKGDRLQRPLAMPPCDVSMGRTDWRLVQELRNSPAPTLGSIARRFGVNPRTVRRRYDRLLDTKALLYFPLFDLTKFPGAVAGFEVRVSSGSDGTALWDAIRGLGVPILPLGPWDGTSLVWDVDPSFGEYIAFLATLPSAGQATRLVAEMERLPGVVEVVAEFPGALRAFPGPIDRLLERKAGRTGVVRGEPFP
jgi:DNA-binding Lrp family transcriptional regulator